MDLHISPSQVKTFRRCKRLHWLQKVAQVPSTKTKVGADRGKALHSLVETYLGSSVGGLDKNLFEFVSENNMFEHDHRHAIKSFCENHEMLDLRRRFHETNDLRLLVEQQFSMGGLYMGIIDLVCVDNLVSGMPKVCIRDHKFLSDRRYIPTEEDLLEDPQTIMYCTAVAKFFQQPSIDMVYDYYGTKSKWYVPRKISLTIEQLNVKWTALRNETLGILDNYLLVEGSDSEANFLSCQMYGGCDYKNICFEN